MSDGERARPDGPPPGPREGLGMGGGFVAGTLVRTSTGLVPIQDVQVGDLVQARPNVTSEPAWRRVVGRSVRADRTLEALVFVPAGERDAARPVFVNGNQPFWLVGAGWTPACVLPPGAVVRLADGREARLARREPVWRTHASNVGWIASPDGAGGHEVDFANDMAALEQRPFDDDLLAIGAAHPFFHGAVFGLEIESLHAFHVGEPGLWVHDIDCGAAAATGD
ncbi:MAG TPA: hypothetical protein VIP05_32540 [Burkholderiaceae bacterium]